MEDNKGTALLFELRGEHPGAVHVLSGDLFRVGSDSENDLVLKDRHVALYQAEIHVAQNQFTLKNLSLEGTAFLNGESFGEAALHRGDVLTFGDSIFRFVEPGESFSQEDLWKPVGGKQDFLATPLSPFRRAPYLMILTLLAAAAVILVMVGQREKKREAVREAPERIARFEGKVSQGERRTLYARALDLLAARRWDEAVNSFEKIREDTPSYKDTAALYNKALLESDALGALNQAKGSFLEEEFSLAKKQLERIPEQSVYYREAMQFHREINRRSADRRLQIAEELLEQKAWAEAKDIAASVLEDQPDNIRARQILRMANLQQGRVERGKLPYHEVRRMEKAEAKPPVKPDAVVSRPVAKKKRIPPKGTPEWYFYTSADVYGKGDVNRSVSLLQGMVEKGTGGPERVVEAKERILAMKQAMHHFEQAKAFQQEGRLQEAAEEWERFLERDRKVMGSGKGTYFRDASASLSRIYFERGKEAYDRDDLGKAYFFWSMAERVFADDKKVKMGLQRLAESAKEFYLEGYTLQEVNPNRAAKRWQEVLEIVPSGNPYYKKAYARFRSHPFAGFLTDEETIRVHETRVAKSPREIYREGYVLQAINPDRAVEKWTEVLKVLPPGHPYHRKAEALIRLQEKTP